MSYEVEQARRRVEVGFLAERAMGYMMRELGQDNAEWYLDRLDDAELHRVARAADALAALCYAKAGPRTDALPAVET